MQPSLVHSFLLLHHLAINFVDHRSRFPLHLNFQFHFPLRHLPLSFADSAISSLHLLVFFKFSALWQVPTSNDATPLCAVLFSLVRCICRSSIPASPASVFLSLFFLPFSL